MSYKPWEVQENLWKEKCSWGNSQNKAFLVNHMAQRTGKSIAETLYELWKRGCTYFYTPSPSNSINDVRFRMSSASLFKPPLSSGSGFLG